MTVQSFHHTVTVILRYTLSISTRALCFILFFSDSVLANSVRLTLQNGDVLSGNILKEDQSTVTLQTLWAAALEIPVAQIAQRTRIELDEPSTSSSAAISSDSRVNNNEKAWSLQLDASAAARHGKQDSSALNFSGKAVYTQRHWRAQLDSQFDYELKDNTAKTHQYAIGPSLDYFIQPRLFWRASLDHRYNYLASDYRNLDLSTGPGYAVFQQTDLKLDLVAALGSKQAYFRQDDELGRLVQQRDRLSYTFSSLEWNFLYRWRPWPLELFSDGQWTHLLHQPIPFLYFEREITANLGLRYHLTDRIHLSWSYFYEQTDLELRLPGITHRFDIKDRRQKFSIGANF